MMIILSSFHIRKSLRYYVFRFGNGLLFFGREANAWEKGPLCCGSSIHKASSFIEPRTLLPLRHGEWQGEGVRYGEARKIEALLRTQRYFALLHIVHAPPSNYNPRRRASTSGDSADGFLQETVTIPISLHSAGHIKNASPSSSVQNSSRSRQDSMS